MPIHSRPHLTTHNRDKNHSAVGAAAYRMGLRLLDRRTNTWHDYIKRAAGEEVVAAFTVAPPGAPDWVHDPDELWNRVEECEKRRDAQVCRDYVVPIPLGLGDTQARELATRLARYISEQHHTVVSVGVHRDAEVDLFGNIKPAEKQGFHAHLLFPTRELAAEGAAGSESDHGFGKKLSVLSNRRTSSGLVELMNKEWAALANELMAEAGLTADYDHRSYVRLGIDRVPLPKLSQAAVAMERSGFFTRQGDRVRDILATTEVHKQAHTQEMDAQHAQALADIVREAVAPQGAASPPPDTSDQEEVSDVAEDLEAARQRATAPDASLADRFVAKAPVPADAAGRQRLFSLSGVVWMIQRSLAAVASVSEKLAEKRDELGRWRHALLDGLDRLDEARRWRKKLEDSAKAWVKSHPFQSVSHHGILSWRNRPKDLVNIERDIDRARRVVEERNATIATLEQTVAFEESKENELMVEHTAATEGLAAGLQKLVAIDDQAAPTLMAVLPDEHRETVAGMLGEVSPARMTALPVEEPPALRLGPPRPRPSR